MVAGLDVGYAAGLYAGSQTISAAIGVATDQIERLGYTPEQAKAYADAVPIGYAVTYIFGTIGSAIVLAQLGPKLIGVDLAAACADYERQLGAGIGRPRCRRLLRLSGDRAARLPHRRRVRSDWPARARPLPRCCASSSSACGAASDLIDADADTVLMPGDVVALVGPHQVLVERLEPAVPEVHDPALLDLPATQVDVFVTSKAFSGKTIARARGPALRARRPSPEDHAATWSRYQSFPRRRCSAATS